VTSNSTNLRPLNVVFDIGGVLLDWNPDAIIERHYDEPQLRAAIKQQVFKHPDWHQLDAGTLSEAAAIERFRQRTDRPLAEMQALMQTARESLLPITETWALVGELAARKVPLYCLSNMPVTTYDYLRTRYDFWPVFQGIVISGHLKMAKPDPAIFEHLLQTHRLNATDTIFIDDHPPNIDTALELGLKALLFRGAAGCRRELEAILGG
jgi:putative hydrolase of the HAD superfamily